MAGVWGVMPTLRILIVPSADRGRPHIQKKKKGALLLRRMKETQSGFLGLNQGQHGMAWAGVGTSEIYLHACAARQKHWISTA